MVRLGPPSGEIASTSGRTTVPGRGQMRGRPAVNITAKAAAKHQAQRQGRLADSQTNIGQRADTATRPEVKAQVRQSCPDHRHIMPGWEHVATGNITP